MKSNDGGVNWDTSVNLYHSDAGVNYPDIAISGLNNHVVWGDYNGWNEIYYCNSTNGGIAWNPVKRISSNGVDAFAPKLFVEDTNIHIIWQDERDGADREIYYRRSIDEGITFDNGQGVNEDKRLTSCPSALGSGDIEGFGSNISVLWTDASDGDSDRYWMISKDNGYNWENGLGTPNIGRKLTDDATSSDKGTVAMINSTIHIIWVDSEWPGPLYRLYYRNSTDMGTTWNNRLLLAGPNVLINNPDIKVDGNNVNIVWDDARDDGITLEIYCKNSSDGGITWGQDIRITYSEGFDSMWPRIAVNGTTKHITWWDLRNGNREIYYKRYPDFPPDPTYIINLNEGWNLISTPLAQRNESINKVLENITGKWDVVKYYNTLDKADPWKTYRPGSSVNDLASIDNTMGFWVYINQPNVTLTVSGTLPTTTTINLYAGWNLVGYPTQATQTVGNALWGTGADRVEVFDLASPYIKEVGATYIMKPGEGYWVHVPADTIWVVNW